MINNKEKEKSDQPEENTFHIDYDNIDVADIMSQIKKRIASQPQEEKEYLLEGESLIRGAGDFFPPEPPVRTRSKLRGLLLKMMNPFAPLIKLLILPVHEEVRETIENLDYTNKRLDYFNQYFSSELQKLGETLGRLEKKQGEFEKKIEKKANDIGEYTKLLHQLVHNLVVELTKLKIEEENLKIQTRILEKDFSFLSKKEKELEKTVLK